MKKEYQIYFPLLISLALAIGMMLGYGLKSLPVDTDTEWVERDINRNALAEVMGLIDNSYYEDQESSGLVDAAIYNVIDELDPYSSYIPPYHMDLLEISNTGKYKGLGIETTEVNGDIFISRVLQNGPAYDRNVLKGSKMLSIDGVGIKENQWNSDSLSSYLMKSEEKEMVLLLDHPQYADPKEISVLKSEVSMPNISDVFKLSEEVGYIRISKFGEGTYKEFMEAVEILSPTDSLANLVIDIRSNPGGYLQEVCKIISQFLPNRIQFLQTVDADGDAHLYNSNGQSFFEVGNIFVLIDKNSASASEILAGVIQDMDRGIVIGEESFGKGLVQEQFDLSNGGVLRLSVSRYQLPSGRYIGRQEKDTISTFTTLGLKRSIKGNGHIIPDIALDPTGSFTSKDAFSKAMVSIGESKVASLEGGSYVEFINSQNLDDLNTSLAQQYQEASVLFGENEVKKDFVLKDPIINEAIRLSREGDQWDITQLQ